MSFESPKKAGKGSFADNVKRPSLSFLDDSPGLSRTPIKEKFKSIISKASHRSSTASFGSFNSKRKSFEVLNARDAANTSGKPNLAVQAGSPESDRKRESASTYSETSTEFNSSSPLPPGSFMDVDDDYEYYRYYYNYHQQQHQGTTSHIIENLESSGSSKDAEKADENNKNNKNNKNNNNNTNGNNGASHSSTNSSSSSGNGKKDIVEFRKRNIVDEPISEEATKSSIVLSPSQGESDEPKLDILSISTGVSSGHKHRISDDEEIERQKNKDEQQNKSAARQLVYVSKSANNSGKRKSHPPSSTSVNTYITTESFHSAVSDLDDNQSQATTDMPTQKQNLSQANLLAPGSDGNKRGSNDPRFSTNSRNTLKNIYSAYLNDPDDANNQADAGSKTRSSSIYDSNRASTIAPNSNRNTVTPSLLDAMASDINSHPLPDVNKYGRLGSASTLSLKRDITSMQKGQSRSQQHFRSKSSSINSIDVADVKAAVVYASGASPSNSSGSGHTRSRSVSSGLSSSSGKSNKRNSKASENIIGNNSSNRLSQGFYFESEEPLGSSSAQDGNFFSPRPSQEQRRFSNAYSKAQTKFPLLGSPSLFGGNNVLAGPSRNLNRDTVTTTNTYTSSSYGGSNYRSSYQTNVTSPTATYNPTSKQPTTLQYQHHLSGAASSRYTSKDYSLAGPETGSENRFDTYDKRLQELQTNLNEEAEEDDEDEIDLGDEDEDERKIRSGTNDNDNDSIFVPPYLNNTAHTQSSSFSSSRKNGQESFKSSKSNNNLNAATLAAATSAAATESAIAANQTAISNPSPPSLRNQSNDVPNLLNDDKKLFIRPVSYQPTKDITIRSTTNSGLARPSTGFHSNNAFATPNLNNNKYYSNASPTTPFSPLSIQNDKYIKSINDETMDRVGSLLDSSYSSQGVHKFKSTSKSKLKPFNLKPSGTFEKQNSNDNGAGISNIDDIEQLKYNYNHNYVWQDTHDGLKCSSNTAVLLLLIGIFVPPLYLVMCFGFLDHSVGFIPRKYKLIAAGLSMFVTILSIVGICVGFGVGLT